MKSILFVGVLLVSVIIVFSGCTGVNNTTLLPNQEKATLKSTLGSCTTIVYPDQTLSDWNSGNFPQVWDLNKCDLTLSYTIDMSNITTAGWAVTEVGLRELNAPNIDPNLQGGWMQSNYIDNTSNPGSLNINDFHLLSKHGWDSQYQKYDASDQNTLIDPYWSGNNYGFWFDRDGVDQWQAQQWGMENGGTYNTGGVYKIIITYHKIDDNTGTMFATINGVQQGLYIGGWKNAQPEFYPAGRSFTADITALQVFYGRGGGGGIVKISDITINGCLRTITINGCDTGVFDKLYDGVLISELIEKIHQNAINHGQFVKGVAQLTNDLMKSGIITGEEKGKIQSCAAKSYK